MDGLAQQGAMQAQGQAQQIQQLLQELVKLLMQGVDPRELIKQGAPAELVKKAMEIVAQQQQGGGQPMDNDGDEGMQQQPVQGLAGQPMQ